MCRVGSRNLQSEQTQFVHPDVQLNAKLISPVSVESEQREGWYVLL